MIVLGVEITNLISYDEQDKEIPVYNRYTGEQDDVESVNTVVIELKTDTIHITATEIDDWNADIEANGGEFIKLVEKEFSPLSVFSEQDGYYFEDDVLYVGIEIDSGVGLEELNNIWTKNTNYFLDKGFTVQDIKLYQIGE